MEPADWPDQHDGGDSTQGSVSRKDDRDRRRNNQLLPNVNRVQVRQSIGQHNGWDACIVARGNAKQILAGRDSVRDRSVLRQCHTRRRKE
jgi:hypothetical protein